MPSIVVKENNTLMKFFLDRYSMIDIKGIRFFSEIMGGNRINKYSKVLKQCVIWQDLCRYCTINSTGSDLMKKHYKFSSL